MAPTSSDNDPKQSVSFSFNNDRGALAVISFAVELFFALLVFTLTEHYIDELKRWRDNKK